MAPKRIEYVALCAVTKKCEGGTGVSDALQVLRRKGIGAKRGHSPYVGMEELHVQRGQITAAREALRPYGWAL